MQASHDLCVAVWYEWIVDAVHAMDGIGDIWNSFNCLSDLQFGVAETLSGLRCFKTSTRCSTTDLDHLLESLENDILSM